MRTFWKQISDAWNYSEGNKGCMILGALVLIFGCIFGIALSKPSRTVALATPVQSPSLTYRQIEDQFNALTDLQREQYLPTLVGQSVHWRGKVNNVESDGSLDLDVGQRGAFYNVALIGVPKELSLQYNRGDSVIFDAMITKAVRAVGFDMTLEYTSIVKE